MAKRADEKRQTQQAKEEADEKRLLKALDQLAPAGGVVVYNQVRSLAGMNADKMAAATARLSTGRSLKKGRRRIPATANPSRD